MRLNPFPGAQPYRETDRKRFFGRAQMAEKLVATVLTRRCLTVFGPSGAGKSSLMQAAVIPPLVDTVGLRAVRVDAWPPDEPAAQRLADAMYAGLKLGSRPVEMPLVDAVVVAAQRAARRSTRPILIYLDQLEQLLLTVQQQDSAKQQADPEKLRIELEKRQQDLEVFFESVDRLSDLPIRDLHLVLSLREDYLGRLRDRLSDRRRLLEHGFRVGPLSVDELVKAVCQAAKKGEPSLDWPYEMMFPLLLQVRAPGQPERPDAEAQSAYGQIVCRALWEERATEIESGAATANHAPALEAEPILKHHLETTLAKLGANASAAQLLLEKHLITSDGDRTLRTLRELGEVVPRDQLSTEELREVLKELDSAAILRAEEHQGTVLYELGHDWLAKKVHELKQAREREERRRADETRRAAEERQKEQQLTAERRKQKIFLLAAGGSLLLVVVLAVALVVTLRARETAESATTDALAARAWAEAGKAMAQLDRIHAEDQQRIAEDEKAKAKDDREWANLLATKARESADQADEATLGAQTAAESEAKAKKEALSQKEIAQEKSKLAKARELQAKRRFHLALMVAREVNERVEERDTLLYELLATHIPRSTRRHPAVINSVSSSPDGKLVAVASSNSAWLWNADGSGVAKELPSPGARVTLVTFSPVDQHLVVVSEDKVAQLWDLGQAKPSAVSLDRHTKEITLAAWSHDGKHVVTTSRDKTARVWTADGKPVAVFDKHEGGILSAAWSPGDDRIVTGAWDKTARVWNPRDGAPQGTPKEHEHAVDAVTWSHDGAFIATRWKQAKAVWVWKADGTGDNVSLSHENEVHSIAWSPGDMRLVTASGDRSASLWSPTTSKVSIPLLGHKGRVRSAAWSEDGKRIVTASADGTARIWNAEDPREFTELAGNDPELSSVAPELSSAVWSRAPGPGGNSPAKDARIVTVSADQTMRVWDANSFGDRLVRLPHKKELVRRAIWARNSNQILTWATDSVVRIWNLAGKTGPREIPHDDWVSSAAWSGDDSKIVTTCADGSARIWSASADASTTTPIVTIPYDSGEIVVARWSHTGASIAAVASNGRCLLWNAQDPKKVMLLDKIDKSLVSNAFWSHDDRYLLTVHRNGELRIWDPVNLKTPPRVLAGLAEPDLVRWSPVDDRVLLTPRRGGSAKIVHVSDTQKSIDIPWPCEGAPDAQWSLNGSRIVAGCSDGTARVWSVDSGQITASLPGHSGSISSLAWSPEGKHIVTASDVARIWSSDGKGKPATLDEHRDWITSVAWSPDGKHIVTTSMDGSALVWLHTTSVSQDAVNATADCLHPAHRQDYLGEPENDARTNYEGCERGHGRDPTRSR